jgi:single-strand DNA-binding protein
MNLDSTNQQKSSDLLTQAVTHPVLILKAYSAFHGDRRWLSGQSPELRYTPEGTPVCNFSVATTERRKDKSGELQETTTWFQVALFGRRAEVANEYLSKGSHVWLEGPLTLDQWTDREGAARVNLEVRASDIKFLSSSTEKATAAAAAAEVTSEDDVAS